MAAPLPNPREYGNRLSRKRSSASETRPLASPREEPNHRKRRNGMAVFFARPGSRRSSVSSTAMEKSDAYMRTRETILVHPVNQWPASTPTTRRFEDSEDATITVGSLFTSTEFMIPILDDTPTHTPTNTNGGSFSRGSSASSRNTVPWRRRASRIIAEDEQDNGLALSRQNSVERRDEKEREEEKQDEIEIHSALHAIVDDEEDDGEISPLKGVDNESFRSISSRSPSVESASPPPPSVAPSMSTVPYISISEYLSKCRRQLFNPRTCKSRLEYVYGITQWNKPSDDVQLILEFVAETMSLYAHQITREVVSSHQSHISPLDGKDLLLNSPQSMSPSRVRSLSSGRTNTISSSTASRSSIFSLVTPRSSQRVAQRMEKQEKTDIVVSCFRILRVAMECHVKYLDFIMDSGIYGECIGILKRLFEVQDGDVLEEVEYQIVLHVLHVLCSLAHASQKNKIVIAEQDGANVILKVIDHISMTQTIVEDIEYEDEEVHTRMEKFRFTILQNAFRCLANFAFVQDNINTLIHHDVLDATERAVQVDLFRNDYELVNNICVFLSNLCSHRHVQSYLVNGTNILALLEAISRTHPSEIDVQRSILGCWGNLATDGQTSGVFLKTTSFRRVLEMMEELVFDQGTLDLCLKLVGLTVGHIIANGKNIDMYADILVECNLFDVIEGILSDYPVHFDIITSCTQTLWQVISDHEIAEKFGTQERMITMLSSLLNEPDNFSNPHIIIDIFKLFLNLSMDEMNTELITKQCVIPILRVTELYPRSPTLMSSTLSLLLSLSRFPSSGKLLVKRGGIAVCMACVPHVGSDLISLSKLIGIFGHFLLVNSMKLFDKMGEWNVYPTLFAIAQRNPYFKPIQDEWMRFDKLYAARAAYLRPSRGANLTTRDRLHISDVRVFTAGVLMKHYTKKGRAHPRIIKTDDTCSLLLVEDPSGVKPAKYVDILSIKNIDNNSIASQSRSFQSVRREKRISIECVDGSNNIFSIDLEARTTAIQRKWILLLNKLVATANTPQNNDHYDI